MIRKIAPEDRAEWQRLYQGYQQVYGFSGPARRGL